jgi:precorrin-6B methylase 2
MRNIKRVYTYLEQMMTVGMLHRESFSIYASVKCFARWRRSLDLKESILLNDMPWLNYLAIDFLDDTLDQTMTVFEYSTGASTLFFAKRVKRVISVEHNIQWYNRVSDQINECGYCNCYVILSEPLQMHEGDDCIEYLSSDESYTGMSFERYAKTIDVFPENHFDVVLIDGRSRVGCVKRSLTKVKKGGILVLDNAEREEYQSIHELLDGSGWQKVSYFGPGPYVTNFWQTVVWERPLDQ